MGESSITEKVIFLGTRDVPRMGTESVIKENRMNKIKIGKKFLLIRRGGIKKETIDSYHKTH
jgi:hypothetical protein